MGLNLSIRALLLVLGVALINSVAWSEPKAIPDGYQDSGILDQPQTTISYYYLDAVTGQALARQLRERGPVDPAGVSRDATTYWKVKWKWSPGTNGFKSDWSTLKCHYTVKVTLPRWVPIRSLTTSFDSQAQIAEWMRFTKAIGIHERLHVEMIAENYQKICEAISKEAKRNPEMDSKAADKVADRVLAQLHKNDLDYDRETDNGRSQGARLKIISSN